MPVLSDSSQDAASQPPKGAVLHFDAQVADILSPLAEQISFLPSTDAGPRYLRDWSDTYGVLAPVVRPRTPEALAAVVQALAARGIRMVAQGGMSGLTGGAAPLESEVVVSTELLRTIEDCDVLGATMTVQAGVTLQAVQETAESHGLFYPVDLGARGSCTIGGNLATNAGGNRVLQYGMTRASVLGVEVVLPDGAVLSRLVPVVKDNAGYDLKQLFVGAEGTLGIVTRAVLRLQPLPRERVTVALGLQRLDQVLDALVACRRHFGPGLTSFEVMWQSFFGFVTQELGIGRDPFAAQAPFIVLLEISCFDPQPARDMDRIAEALEAMASQLDTPHVVIAQSLKEAAELWRVRDASGEAARALGAYLSFDISIPAKHLQATLQRIESALDAIAPMRRLLYGHLGDGNIHLVLASEGLPLDRVEAVVHAAVQACGGSISAEHGIGLSKAHALAEALPAAAITTMRRIKHALDPQGLLNRGRVLVAD